jgi:hypothetical protein
VPHTCETRRARGAAGRILAAYAEHPFAVRDSRAMIGHDPRGGTCNCENLPDGQIVTVHADGRVQ